MEVLDWGLIDYEKALSQQLELVEDVASERSADTLIFCTHPAVVTLGRATQPGDVFAWEGPVREISRGGRATYHGPSQLVVYPILNLAKTTSHRPAKDIGHYLRSLEKAIVDTLKEFGVEAQGRSLQQKNGEETAAEETGVWVKRQKIASLGIGVRKWVTYHGAAINLTEDKQAFTGMRPCGFSQDVMTNLERLTESPPDRMLFQEDLTKRIVSSLS
jgi:lipoyl(octanoyl) transferase